jgi:hypothetical protein
MHTLHWWAVEAEDEQEAFSLVKERLTNDSGDSWVDWSDWHVVGGGRWNPKGDGYKDQSNMILSYAKDPNKFKEILEGVKTARKDEMNEMLLKIKPDKFISDMVDYISNGGVPNPEERFSMNNYYISIATDLLSDSYKSSSYFYDMKEFTAHMEYVYERLDKSPENMGQYLVPVDFHF